MIGNVHFSKKLSFSTVLFLVIFDKNSFRSDDFIEKNRGEFISKSTHKLRKLYLFLIFSIIPNGIPGYFNSVVRNEVINTFKIEKCIMEKWTF
jgi:hypothetical protein